LKGILWVATEASFYPIENTQVVDYMVQALKKSGFQKLWKVFSQSLANQWKEEISLSFLDEIKKEEPIWIFPGNVPLITEGIILKIKEIHQKHGKQGTCYWLPNGQGICCLEGTQMKEKLFSLIKKANHGGEDFYQLLKEEIDKDTMYHITCEQEEELLVIDSPVALAQAGKALRFRINQKHMKQGVILLDPDQVYIESEVEIESGVMIYPGTFLQGKTKIEKDCVIGPNTRIENSHLHPNVHVEYSVILDSSIGKSSTIGPFAYLRPNSHIGAHVKIGDFVEVKNACIGDYTKASHLTYIGDADIGKNVNFGCGTITVNYDGEKKHRVIVEDDAFIGCNTNLVAPVMVRKGGYIAAGSTITKEVPEDALAIARARQENKEQWKQKRKKKQESLCDSTENML